MGSSMSRPHVTPSPSTTNTDTIRHDERDFIHCTGRKRLPKIPPNIKELTIYDGTRLKSLPPLPSNLRILNLWHCREFTAEEYATLPTTLKTLSITAMSVRDITALPQWITRLSLTGTDCEEIPAGTFPNLQYLIVSNSSVHTICVPPRVEDIILGYLPNLTELPSFPSTLKSLRLSNVPITMLPPFPNIHVNVCMDTTNLPPELLDINQTIKQTYRGDVLASHNTPDNPSWLARINPILEEYERKGRIQQRTCLIRPELLAAAHCPERVAKWLGEGEGNWGLVDTMMGIA